MRAAAWDGVKTVVIAMAGRGARFGERGVTTPKPLIHVAGRPMLAWALKSLEGVRHHRLVFVSLEQHERDHGVSRIVRDLAGASAKVVLLPEVTGGQLVSVLAARALMDPDGDVLIASADTYVKGPLGEDIAGRHELCAGVISVARLAGDRWSFARVQDGRVAEVAEKVRISDLASTGLYYFTRARDLLTVADDLIRTGQTTRGEYYVIPVYQSLIAQGARIEVSVATDVWDMGNPEALAAFEEYLADGGEP